MKYIILFLLCYYSTFGTELKTKATPKEVIVYTDGAQITSDVAITIPKGSSIVRITDLSQYISQNTIQISGLKDASIISIGFDILFYPKKEVSNKVKELQKEIFSKSREIAVLQSQIKGLEEEESILKENKNLSSSQQAVNLEKLLQHSKLYRERMPVIKIEIFDLNKKISDLQIELNAMQQELNNTNSNLDEPKGEIVLKLNNPNDAVALNLTVKYIVSNAGWVPSYEIKAKNTQDALQFAYKAQVYQNTGEDWNDIKLILSTGNPNFNNDKPKLETQYLNFINPNAYTGNKYKESQNYVYNPMIKVVTGIVADGTGPLPGANIVLKGTNISTQTDFDGRYTIKVPNGKELVYSFIGYDNKVIPIYSTNMNVVLKEGVKLEEVVVQGYRATPLAIDSSEDLESKKEELITGSGDEKEIIMNTVTFKIKKNYSIPSLDTPSIIEIDNFTIPAEFEYYSAPLLSENVFLTAKFKDWNKYDLLPGDASIYTEGSYAGTTYINPYQTEEDLVISMGVDSNLIIERKQLNNTKDKSFLGGTRIIDRNYEITVRNNKASDIVVKVYDRIPISQNKEIKVEKENIDGAEFEEKTGILVWQLSISPKQIVKKQLAYQVKYPKNKKTNL